MISMNSSNAGTNSFLDPQTVSRLGRLDLIARFVVEGFVTGLHRSPYHGFSVEFSEHRPYIPGDPLRNLDWKALAKTERLYVKRYEEETNVKAYIVLDVSGSMAFKGVGVVSKFRYGSCLAAALSYLMLRQRDAVGLILFRDRALTHVPPRSMQSHLNVLLTQLAQIEPAENTRVAPVLHDLAERLSRRSLVILLSDFLDDADQVLSGLRHFRHRGHEVIALQLLDPRELDLNFNRSNTRFVDLEDPEERVQTQPGQMQVEYQTLMKDLLETYRRGCAETGVDYTLIDTTTSFDVALSRYLVRRKRLG